jgi:hypothetical protein
MILMRSHADALAAAVDEYYLIFLTKNKSMSPAGTPFSS